MRVEVALGSGKCTLWLNPTRHDPTPHLSLRYSPQNGELPHTFNTPHSLCTDPKPLKVKSGEDEQDDSRGDLFTDGTLSASPQLCSTGPTVHPSHTPHDCIRRDHYMHEGPTPFLQRRGNLRSSKAE